MKSSNRRAASASVGVYSFISWIATITVYIIFLIWSLTPEPYLRSFGITYYPPKRYAVDLTIYAIFIYVMSCIAYMSWNMIQTPAPESVCTLRCCNGKVPPRASNSYIKCSLKDGIPDVADMDRSYVSYLIATSTTSSTQGTS